MNDDELAELETSEDQFDAMWDEGAEQQAEDASRLAPGVSFLVGHDARSGTVGGAETQVFAVRPTAHGVRTAVSA